MSNVWTVAILVFIMGLMSKVALSLGLTTGWTIIDTPETPDAVPTGGVVDTLSNMLNWVTTTIGSFFQLLTFQADLPDVFSIMFLVMTFMLLYIIIVIIRGGAG